VISPPVSDPFVPPGHQHRQDARFTSDDAINLEWLPGLDRDHSASGYIGLEFADSNTFAFVACEVHDDSRPFDLVIALNFFRSPTIAKIAPGG